jgi:O-antigen ligase
MTLINDKNRYLLIFVIGFLIPISTAASNLCILFVLLFLLLEGGYQQKFKKLFASPLARIALILFSMTLLGILYSSVDISEAIQVFKKYREFFYIPLFLLLFRDKQSRTWGLYGFLGAMGVTLFIAYFTAIISYEGTLWRLEESSVFKNYITQNIMMTLAVYFLAIHCLNNSRWRWLIIIVICLALYNILFVSLGRTGYLILFCLIPFFFFQIYRWRGLLITSALLIFSIVILYSSSQAFQTRINNISEDLQRLQFGNIDTTNSIGTRIEYAENSLLLIKDNPVIGTGTGSFSYEYNLLAREKGLQFSDHPHNEYLLITVQWGLVGLFLFLTFLFLLWKSSNQLEKQYQYMAQGLVITIAVGCLFNSLWLDTTEGYIFSYLIGLLYGESRT